jgi:adenylate kinase
MGDARVTDRFVCAGCVEGYQDDFEQIAESGVCQCCGGTAFARRADDNAETVRARLDACHVRTAAPIAFHEGSRVHRVDMMGSIDDIGAALAGLVTRVTA